MRHRSAKLLALLLCILLACSVLGGCAQAEQQNYSTSFFDVFDTVTTIIGYAESKEAFTAQAQQIHDELLIYHQLFDIYNTYPDIQNLKTVNDNAGIAPVQVDRKLIDLLLFCR